MRTSVLVVLLSVCLAGCDKSEDEFFGTYNGTVQTEWLDDGRTMRLLADVSFEDPNGLVWSAKRDDLVNGASIPSLLWSLVGAPYAGKYRSASVIHDVACQEKSRTWEVVHLAFYYAMRASGVSEKKAKIMYAGVYHGGPRWPIIRSTSVLVAEASETIVDVPAKYEMVSEEVLVEPEQEVWKSRADIGSEETVIRVEVDNSGLERVLVRTPARYDTITEEILVQPATQRRIAVPAEYKTTQETVEPPEKLMSNDEILVLAQLIEADDAAGSSYSLAQIRDYQN